MCACTLVSHNCRAYIYQYYLVIIFFQKLLHAGDNIMYFCSFHTFRHVTDVYGYFYGMYDDFRVLQVILHNYNVAFSHVVVSLQLHPYILESEKLEV